MWGTKRKLEPSKELYEPRPNIGYKIRANNVRKSGSALGDAILGAFCIFLLTATFASTYRDTHQTPPEPQEEVLEAEVVIQSIGTHNLWRNIPRLDKGTDEQNEKIAYAYMISGNNIEYVYVLNGENGLWTHDRVHNPGANTVGVDMGFGINSYFHPEIVNDEKFWNDWKWNIDRTFQLWDSGVTFYGYSKKGIII